MTNADRCAVCGGMLALVGIRHRCIPGVVTAIETSPAPLPESARGTYRHRDPEKWRAYMRDYMKRRRAKQSGASDGGRAS